MNPRLSERYRGGIKAEQIAGYLKALKIVIASDSIDPQELAALRTGMRWLGVSSEVRREVEDFDPAGKRLLDVLPGFRLGSLEARHMLRDAIELASSDGIYSQAERSTITRIAALLGVSKEVVLALEGLTEMERACRRLRKALLGQAPILPR